MPTLIIWLTTTAGLELSKVERKNRHKIAHITRDLSRIAENEVIIVYIQTTYHEDLIKRIIPYLREEQILLFNPVIFQRHTY